MAYASGNLKRLVYVAESTWGVTPSGPALDGNIIRHIGESLQHQRDSFRTQEIRVDRQISDVRLGQRRAGGDINCEMIVAAHDDLIEAALGGTWAAVTTGSTTLDAGSSSTFTRASGSFVTDGFKIGDEILASGFTNGQNNGRFKLTNVAALTLTVEGTPLTTETGGGDETISGYTVVQAGVAMPSFTIERQLTDITRFQAYKGMVVNTMGVELRPNAMNLINFGFVGDQGVDAGATATTGTYNTLSTHSPLASFQGVIQEGGSAIAIVTALTMNLDNGRQSVGVVGAVGSPAIFEGESDITGSVTLMMEDSTLLAKFIAETETSIDVRLDDVNGVDLMHIRLPRVKYTAGNVAPPREGPVLLTLPFQALYDSVSGTNIRIQRSNA